VVPGARSRIALEAAFLIAVAVVVGLRSLSLPGIAAVMGGAWLLVALTELRASRRQRLRSLSAEKVPEPAADPEPLREPVPAVESETPPEPLEADPDGVAPPLPERPPTEEPLIDVEPGAEPNRESAHAPVVPQAAPRAKPREWNIWDLQRALRTSAAADAERDEERAYLLMYLREFAGPDGALPATFDRLVRDSFGDLLRSQTR
jgi:hypothetical protein